MNIHWSDVTRCYEFDTGPLFGGIAPRGHYHGICGLMHRDQQVDVVRPGKAFLNAEYYLRPGSGAHMLPRALSTEERTTHELRDGVVVVRFPAEPQFGLEMELAYRPHEDAVDMQMTISPTRDVPAFEIFFASYVCEAMTETWLSLAGPAGAADWVKPNNRAVVNDCFGAVRDDAARSALDDGRWGAPLTSRPEWHLESRPFDRPILLARDPANGMTLAFLCDASATTMIGGQYHGWDTAHDWSLGQDLLAGRPTTARVRLVYRRFAGAELMFDELQSIWSDFASGGQRAGDWLLGNGY